jgi:hypothetical protein
MAKKLKGMHQPQLGQFELLLLFDQQRMQRWHLHWLYKRSEAVRI